MPVDRGNSIQLRDLTPGDLVRSTAFDHHKRPEHSDFLILEAGERPRALLTQTKPTGEVVGPAEVLVVGTGHYLTLHENPVQDLPGQITIFYGELNRGGDIVFRIPGVDGPEGRRILNGRSEVFELYAHDRVIPQGTPSQPQS